jgi:hypothetical protein
MAEANPAQMVGRNLTDEEMGRVVDTPTPCSCWMCGNPRKYFGERTIGERRAMQDLT